MKYAVKMGSGAMIYIPSFIKTGSGIKKLIRGDTQAHRQHDDLISLLPFFQNNESRPTTHESEIGGSFTSVLLRINFGIFGNVQEAMNDLQHTGCPCVQCFKI
jgi:hypothetical protein